MRISGWSSDVCSSDLRDDGGCRGRLVLQYPPGDDGGPEHDPRPVRAALDGLPVDPDRQCRACLLQIGRASCRERVCQYVSTSVFALPFIYTQADSALYLYCNACITY